MPPLRQLSGDSCATSSEVSLFCWAAKRKLTPLCCSAHICAYFLPVGRILFLSPLSWLLSDFTKPLHWIEAQEIQTSLVNIYRSFGDLFRDFRSGPRSWTSSWWPPSKNKSAGILKTSFNAGFSKANLLKLEVTVGYSVKSLFVINLHFNKNPCGYAPWIWARKDSLNWSYIQTLVNYIFKAYSVLV